MTETIDAAITALQNISNQWYTVGAKYNNLLQNVKGISPEEFAFIKEDLNTAKDSWKDVKDYTENYMKWRSKQWTSSAVYFLSCFCEKWTCNLIDKFLDQAFYI